MRTDMVFDLPELELWQFEQTKQAIAEAESGDFATLAELQTVLTKYDPQISKP